MRKFIFSFIYLFVIVFGNVLLNTVSYENFILNKVLMGFSFIALIMFILLYIVEIVSKFKIYDSTMYTANMTLFIILFVLTTRHFNKIYSLNGIIINSYLLTSLNFLTFLLYFYFSIQFIYYTYYEKIKLSRHIIYLSVILCLFISNLILKIYNYDVIIVYLSISLVILKLILFTIFNKTNYNQTFYLIKLIICLMLGLFLTDSNPISNTLSNILFVLYLFLIVVSYLLIYVYFIIRTYTQAINGMKLEISNNNLKMLLLKDQIKPHFVFNTLNTIKSLYHKDLDEGDKAIQLFSNHLRYNVETTKTNMIEFSKELENIYNFIELENLKAQDQFNVIYNIEYEDYMIPILSIEPFVENAIKYSMVNKKDDGYIEISSTIDNDNYITISIIDNGIGFDINKIKNTSCGIENAKERLTKLVNASININSIINEGTNITIKFRKDNYENNNSR